MNNCFVDFLLRKGLYDEMHITKDNVQELYNLILGSVRISVYCKECKAERVFAMNSLFYYTFFPDGSIQQRNLGSDLIYYQNIQSSSGTKALLLNGSQEWSWTTPALQMYTRVIHFPFVCAMDSNHHLDFIVEIHNNTMRKIGQYPSVADISFPELEQYKKVMSETNRREMRKAIGLFAHGIGAGSYVYLRRIFEETLDMAKKKAEADINNTANLTGYEKLKVVDKVDRLKDYLPEMIVNNKTIYGILSKGIHELSEEECLAYFPVLRDCIYTIMQQWEERRKIEEGKKELQKSLSGIESEIKAANSHDD